MNTITAGMARASVLGIAVVLGTSAFAGLTPISGTYVETGLVSRWDAIDNTGTGMHSQSATTWKDLAGDNDMTIVANSGATWKNGNAFYINSLANGICPAYGKNGNKTYKTIEIVYKKATSKGRIL